MPSVFCSDCQSLTTSLSTDQQLTGPLLLNVLGQIFMRVMQCQSVICCTFLAAGAVLYLSWLPVL